MTEQVNKKVKKSHLIFVSLVLITATLAVFGQVYDFQFVNYDDGTYILNNPVVRDGLTKDGLSWAFTSGHAANWHPLTWLSHMLDCQLFGLNAGMHHVTSLLLHIANSLLLLYILGRTTGRLWPSAFAAALFALHPVHVESVAWVSERKDVLSTLFFMLTILAYVRYAEKPKIIRSLTAVLIFALGLMAKPMLVTLPFVLLLMDYWPLKRFDFGKKRATVKTDSAYSRYKLIRKLVFEKTGFFVLSALSSITTFFVQKHGGAVQRIEVFPFGTRVANAAIGYVGYLWKMLWPQKLAIFYPYHAERITVLKTAAAVFLLLVITVWVIKRARSDKYLAVGWFWYIGTLVPVIGLVQVGHQALADRYTYIPLIGIFIMFSWYVPTLLAGYKLKKLLLTALTVIIIPAVGVRTYLQTGYWRDSLALFNHALDVTDDNYEAHFCLSEPLVKQGKIEQALYHNSQALKIKPDFTRAQNGMGVALIKAGRSQEAIRYLRNAILLYPDCFEAHGNLGIAFMSLGRFDDAARHYKAAMRINPSLETLRVDVALALFKGGKISQAIAEYQEFLKKHPDDADIQNKTGALLVSLGKVEQAVAYFEKAVQIAPEFSDAHYNLGYLAFRQGKFDQAVKHFTDALKADENLPHVHKFLADAFFRIGRIDEAIIHYKKTLQFGSCSFSRGDETAAAAQPIAEADQIGTENFAQLRTNLDNAQIYNKLGNAQVLRDNTDEAICCFQQAVKLNPDFLSARYNLASNLIKVPQKTRQAIKHLRIIIKAAPDKPAAINTLAWLLATTDDAEIRNHNEAAYLADQACKLTEYKNPSFLDTLAAAYAAAGRFDDAVATEEKVLAMLKKTRQKSFISDAEKRLSLYKAGKAYIEKLPAASDLK